MNMIFIFMGAVALFLDLSSRIRTWIIILPFAGVVLDIASVWLKIYVSPAFFLAPHSWRRAVRSNFRIRIASGLV
jgi:hypothetical protein